MLNWQFYLREATSDIISAKLLAEFASPTAIELDYPLAANAPLAQVDTFLSAQPQPNSDAWPVASYLLSLVVQNSGNAFFTVEPWRADLNGNDIVQIGVRPATQLGISGGAQTFQFVVTDPSGQAAATTDRLKLKLFAGNTDAVNPQTFSIMASQSVLSTPIPREMQVSNIFNPYRRGKFLGNYLRAGEGSGYFDSRGVDLN